MINLGKYHLILFGVFMLAINPAENVIAFDDTSQTRLTRHDFYHLAQGGFGDSANSYAWSIASFKGDLYVGVNRHHGASIMGAMEGAINSLDFLPSPSSLFDGPKSDMLGDIVWAEDLSGAIWRLRGGEWSMVHQANILQGVLPIISNSATGPAPTINGYYPESYGYRNMTVYGEHIYALGIGPWSPNMPLARVIRSATGDPGSWEDVSGIIATATNPRGLVEYKGKLYITASLPGSYLAGSGTGLVYCFDPSTPGYWKQVSEPGFGSSNNAEIPDLAVFNGFLYASTLNYSTGFEVWKTDGSIQSDGKYIWKNVVKDGFGDTWNQWGMTMQPFGEYLYIGTAVGGMVFKNNQPVGIRAFDVIRLDSKDHVQLLVGAPIPSDPPAGWPRKRAPLSKHSAGFANPLNVYAWSMGVYDGWLYLGTFDISSNIFPYLSVFLEELKSGGHSEVDGKIPAIDQIQALLRKRDSTTGNNKILLQMIRTIIGNRALTAASATVPILSDTFGGADVWKTKDGIHWVPVTLNGFDNCFNAGVRRLVPVKFNDKDVLTIGTANGYTGQPGGGCEILCGK
ncbi:MAG TPA: hypothetical protein PL032_13525 [Syntrophorhabdus sp.]|nr:hypothetical protein [Syntrophorhabdus sp.]